MQSFKNQGRIGLCRWLQILIYAVLTQFHILILLHSWYFGGIKRPEAEKLLKTPPNEHGAFLVRDSDKGGYALSMKDGDMVKHYKIRTTDTGNFFIAHNNPFTTLSDLIQYYTKTADGLCDVLKKACVKVSGSYDRFNYSFQV